MTLASGIALRPERGCSSRSNANCNQRSGILARASRIAPAAGATPALHSPAHGCPSRSSAASNNGFGIPGSVIPIHVAAGETPAHRLEPEGDAQ